LACEGASNGFSQCLRLACWIRFPDRCAQRIPKTINPDLHLRLMQVEETPTASGLRKSPPLASKGTPLNARDHIEDLLAAVSAAFRDGSLVRISLSGYHGAEPELKLFEVKKI